MVWTIDSIYVTLSQYLWRCALPLQLTGVTTAASRRGDDDAVCTACFAVVTVNGDGGGAIITPTATPS